MPLAGEMKQLFWGETGRWYILGLLTTANKEQETMNKTAFFYLMAVGLLVGGSAMATPVVLFDFTEGMHGWTGNPRVDNMQVTDEGLYFESIGDDPWIESRPVDNMPLDERVRLTVRMKATGDSRGEWFYGPDFTAERSMTFFVTPDGEWHEYSVLLPPQQEGTRLRLDPTAMVKGAFTVAWIKAEAMRPLITTEFSPPTPVELEDPLEIQSGPFRLAHNAHDWDGYALFVDNTLMAMGHKDSALGFMVDDEPVMFPLSEADTTAVLEEETVLRVTASFTDSGGATWQLLRTVSPGDAPGALHVTNAVTVDAHREMFHLPWLTLFPGLNSFGERKTQALLPGVDYLDDEPSSSEASFNAEQADRRIVEDHKLTMPMMALQHEGCYVGVVWHRADMPAAVFDSPDRVFDSGAHLMGLWYPGVGDDRLENEFAVYGAFSIAPDAPMELDYVFLGGHGDSVVAPVQQYVAMRGLPELPTFEGGFDHAVRLMAAGWLDSEAHHDGRWRHAVWGDSFPPQPAADGPAYMLWLAAHTNDDALAQRLRDAAEKGLAQLNPPDNFLANVSHVSRPTPPLLFGAVAPNVSRMVSGAYNELEAFDEEGLRRYHQPDPNRPDYGKTHFEDHANGYGAQTLEPILMAAAFSGDASLIDAGLALLDKQARHYKNTVPRGAQTWEMPLHTPDILGSARMVRIYVLGYLLTGNEDYIEQARYWAWTGIPFVYLDHPVDGPVGAYATIAVLGATNWIAPNWIGLPVQWCGLVYRSALHDLALVDEEKADFWDKVAHGITLSGLQQTFPLDDEARQGLLPDFTFLHEQLGDGPAIIPGTVQAHLAELYGKTPYYTTARINNGNALIHAPGGIDHMTDTGDGVIVDLFAWTNAPYWVRVTGASEDTSAVWNNDLPEEVQYDEEHGAINIRVVGSGTLTLSGL